MDRMTRCLALLFAAALAACGDTADTDIRTVRSANDAETNAEDAANTPASTEKSTSVLPPAARPGGPVPAGDWLVLGSEPPRAAWGARASETALTFSCDHRDQRLLLERAAARVPDSVRTVSIEADGTRMEYPAERREATPAPNLVTAIALDAPIIDRLLLARGMTVTAGDDAIATTAPGDALRAVVDACRRAATP